MSVTATRSKICGHWEDSGATYFMILARYFPDKTSSCSSGVNNVFILDQASNMLVSLLAKVST